MQGEFPCLSSANELTNGTRFGALVWLRGPKADSVVLKPSTL
jgi:hypothetical protein